MSNVDSEGDIALIVRAVLQLGRRLRAERPEASVSLSALGLLRTLHRSGAMPAIELARAEGLQPQSLSRLIAGMESDGLIARTPGERDRRTLRIAITAKGRRTLKHDMEARRRWLDRAMSIALTPDERERLAAAAALMLRLADESSPTTGRRR